MLSKSAIEAKYKRAKLKVCDTHLYSELDKTQCDSFKSLVTLYNGELPVICYNKSPEYGWLITNKRLIIFSDTSIENILFKEILKADIPASEDLKNNKGGIDELKILLLGDRFIQIKVEPSSWHFIFDLIRYLRE